MLLLFMTTCLVVHLCAGWLHESRAQVQPTNREWQIGLTPGWATFGQVLPAGVAREGVRLGSLVTQTDVKTRWPDGSIRFAVISVKVAVGGQHALTLAPVSPGRFMPQIPQALVRFHIDGVSWVAALPDQQTGDRWLSGPLVTEWRTTVAPVSGKTRHPYLRVLFDTRAYVDGQSRLDVTVENTLNKDGAGEIIYDVDMTVNGEGVFRRGGVSHGHLARWRKVFPIGLLASEVTPDFEAAYQAEALPRYLSLVTDEEYSVEGPRFDILRQGRLHNPMNDHGGRPELAPYPDWTAQYLVHKRISQKITVLVHGDLGGSWPIHIRETNGQLISIDEHPNFWLDKRADPDGRPKGDLGSTLEPDIAHQPSLAYVPYLVTGDRYYADEMKFWANYVLLGTFQESFYKARGGSLGLLWFNEVRGFGWGLRNLADAAAYLPDNDSFKALFAQKITNNLKWLDEDAQDETGHNTILGTLWEYKRPENDSKAPQIWIAPMEQNYLAWAIDHTNRQGFRGGVLHRDKVVKFQIKLFTAGAAYPRRYAGPYILAVGEKRANGKIEYYKSLAQVFASTFGDTSTDPLPFQGWYGSDARLMLMIGMENGFPGAREAYDYLHPIIAVEPYVLSSGGDRLVPDLASRSGWAIAPPAGRTSVSKL